MIPDDALTNHDAVTREEDRAAAEPASPIDHLADMGRLANVRFARRVQARAVGWGEGAATAVAE
jgi:hypothetical protein